MAIGPGPAGQSRECSGTGFFANDEGYLLTNAHVVETIRRCHEANGEGEILAKFGELPNKAAAAAACEVIALDNIHDLAVLKVTFPPSLPGHPPPAYLSLDPRGIPIGSPVCVTGHSATAWHATTQCGMITGKDRMRLAEKNSGETSILILNVQLQAGASGSPAYDPGSKAVLGIIEAREALDQSLAVAVPIRYAIELLDHSHVRWSKADGSAVTESRPQ
jgi:S1-C subfamily serine protease